jgi:serine/threonine protein kinase
MQVIRHSDGTVLTLNENSKVGEGGEAKILIVPGRPDLVAKVYKNPTPAHQQKLEAMLENPPVAPDSTGHHSIAWPSELLLFSDGRGVRHLIGFLMPRVQDMEPILEFCNPKSRWEKFPLFNYRYLHHMARNLAVAVHSLHARGYVIGDINESNILAESQARVTLVDTDSFQVRDHAAGIVHRCPVGKPEFTPPELQGVSFRDRDREPSHDLFGLAVIIFQLLMEGTHPFAGRYTGSGEAPTLDQRIKQGAFPYGSRSRLILPGRHSPPFELLSPPLQRLFLHCFEEGHSDPSRRPKARDWQQALQAAEKELAVCPANHQHYYGRHNSACPWCARERQYSAIPSPKPTPAKPAPQPAPPPVPVAPPVVTQNVSTSVAASPVLTTLTASQPLGRIKSGGSFKSLAMIGTCLIVIAGIYSQFDSAGFKQDDSAPTTYAEVVDAQQRVRSQNRAAISGPIVDVEDADSGGGSSLPPPVPKPFVVSSSMQINLLRDQSGDTLDLIKTLNWGALHVYAYGLTGDGTDEADAVVVIDGHKGLIWSKPIVTANISVENIMGGRDQQLILPFYGYQSGDDTESADDGYCEIWTQHGGLHQIFSFNRTGREIKTIKVDGVGMILCYDPLYLLTGIHGGYHDILSLYAWNGKHFANVTSVYPDMTLENGLKARQRYIQSGMHPYDPQVQSTVFDADERDADLYLANFMAAGRGNEAWNWLSSHAAPSMVSDMRTDTSSMAELKRDVPNPETPLDVSISVLAAEYPSQPTVQTDTSNTISTPIPISYDRLKIGSKGSKVKQWQQFLVQQGLMLPPLDGIYGSKTAKATIVFQNAASLNPDGIVGPETLAAAEKIGYNP